MNLCALRSQWYMYVIQVKDMVMPIKLYVPHTLVHKDTNVIFSVWMYLYVVNILFRALFAPRHCKVSENWDEDAGQVQTG